MIQKIVLIFSIGILGIVPESIAQDPNFHIYLCFGQSNMEGTGTIENQDKTINPRVKVLQDQTCSNLNRTYATWYTAVPPLNRCWGGLGPADYFGKTMAAGMPSNITIGLVNTSVGGCDIAFFQKSAPLGKAATKGGGNADIPSQFTGGYAWMLDLAKKAKTVGVIKGIIFHQGETNTGDASWKTKVNEIVTNLRADLGIGNVPFLAGELLYAQYASCCSSHNTEVNKIPSVVSNSYIISASGLPGKDEAHFTSASYRTLGIRYAQKMLSLVNVNTNPVPTVTLISPINNSTGCTGSPVTLSANTSISSGTISKVDFFDGTILLGTDNSSPYSYTWINPTAGPHTIKAVSTSTLNVSSLEAANNITIANATIIEPYMQLNGGIWNAQGTTVLCAGENLSIGPHPVVATGWTWSGPNNFTSSVREISFPAISTSQGGTYTATYKDANGCPGSIGIPVTVNARPVVTITSPANNSTSSSSPIVINANVAGTGITNVQFYNGTNLLGSDASSTYSYSWANTTNGTYTLNVRAINSNNCADTATSKFTLSIITGLDGNEIATGVDCFPNPFHQTFTIQAPAAFSYFIYDLTGTEVSKGKGNSSLNVGQSLASGSYLVKIESESKVNLIKIMKF